MVHGLKTSNTMEVIEKLVV